jgi:hypothetical protein
MNPWIVGGAVLYLGGSWVWRKYIEPPPPRVPPQGNVALPRTDEGAVIPLLYGKCRVRAPIVAWVGSPHFFTAESYFDLGDITIPASGDLYAVSMFLVLGMPFEGGTTRVHKMWAGEMRVKPFAGLGIPDLVDLPALEGNGNFEDNDRPCLLQTAGGDQGSFTMGYVEFLNGNENQFLCDPSASYGPSTVAGRYMTVNNGTGFDDLQGDQQGRFVPGFRGFASVFLYNNFGGSAHWVIGPSPQIPSYSFEVTSYPSTSRLTSLDGVGVDGNPIDAAYDILKGKLGRLGIDPNKINVQSFIDAAVICYGEGNGYSRSVEQEMTAEQLLGEILMQVNGVIYEDLSTGLITIKLIRGDYNPLDLPEINKHNCEEFKVTSAGWQDLPNAIRIVYNDRLRDYQPNSVTAQDLASISASGKRREEVIEMPGVCDPDNAASIAGRTLAELSSPLMTATALVARSMLRVNPGSAVRVVRSNPDISGVVFRVTGVDRGTRADGMIRLDLVQDSFYVWRNQAPQPPDFTTHMDDVSDDVVTFG